MTDPLERPIWSLLNGPQAALSVERGAAVRIDPNYGPFAAMRDCSAEARDALATIVGKYGTAWLVEAVEQPAPVGTRVVRTAPLLQMVAAQPMAPKPDDADCDALGGADVAEMTALATATQPGPWESLTHRYGAFFGIRSKGRLLAMAGERMRPAPGLTEVSGVCTWPEHRGRGYAGMLIRRVMAGMGAREETPFLHSYAGNVAAIALYRSLGFVPTREMVVTVLAPA